MTLEGGLVTMVTAAWQLQHLSSGHVGTCEHAVKELAQLDDASSSASMQTEIKCRMD